MAPLRVRYQDFVDTVLNVKRLSLAFKIIWVKRLARFKNTESKVQQFTHDSNDNFQIVQTPLLKSVGKRFENRIVLPGNDSGHIKGSADGGPPHFRNAGAGVDGRARLAMPGVQASKGDQLSNIIKVRDGTKFSHKFGSRQASDSLDGDEEVALALEIRMVVDMLLNSVFDLLDLLRKKLNLLLQIVLDNGRRRSAVLERIQPVALPLAISFQVGQMAYQAL